MTKRIEGTTPFFNSNVQESKENLNVLLPIFEKAVNAITRPLTEIAQLNEEIQPLQNAVDSPNKKRLEASIIDEERPKKRICSKASFSNLNVQESKENLNILPHSIFAKAIIPIASMRPLAEIAQLINVKLAESKEPESLQIAAVNSLTINKKRHADTPIDEDRPKKRIHFWPNGNKYNGEFFNDLPEGYGTLIYNTGITYVGEFHEGKYHGNGTLTIPKEGEYEGEFKNGLFDGYGTFNYNNGDVFIGYYVRGIRQGKGILYYMEGGSYDGRYRNGNRHGYGILIARKFYIAEDGKIYTAEDREVYTAENGKVYTVEGGYLVEGGEVYKGGFKDGAFDGYGKVTFTDGSSTIEGLFANNLFVSKY